MVEYTTFQLKNSNFNIIKIKVLYEKILGMISIPRFFCFSYRELWILEILSNFESFLESEVLMARASRSPRLPRTLDLHVYTHLERNEYKYCIIS